LCEPRRIDNRLREFWSLLRRARGSDSLAGMTDLLTKRGTMWGPVVTMGIVAGVMVILLNLSGRVWWCSCGHWWISTWDVNSQHNSQHLIDWYAFSHFLHGVIFFGMLWPVRNKIGIWWRAVIAIVIEAGWELLENSPMVIDRYRQTMAQGYSGDSILNSISDLVLCLMGFYVAMKVKWWVSVLLFVVFEVGVMLFIRDNLTLNVIMLLHPFEAIKRWQTGA
jgi:hypothetical protein